MQRLNVPSPSTCRRRLPAKCCLNKQRHQQQPPPLSMTTAIGESPSTLDAVASSNVDNGDVLGHARTIANSNGIANSLLVSFKLLHSESLFITSNYDWLRSFQLNNNDVPTLSTMRILSQQYFPNRCLSLSIVSVYPCRLRRKCEGRWDDGVQRAREGATLQYAVVNWVLMIDWWAFHKVWIIDQLPHYDVAVNRYKKITLIENINRAIHNVFFASFVVL